MTTEYPDGVVPKAPKKKKVAVIGGGPGGITAMQTLLERGHDVTLYEKSGKLGGNVIGAAAPEFKFDARDYLTWLRHSAAQCAERGARILLNTEATKDVLELENYDAIVIAVGADPIIPDGIPGIRKPHVHWAPDASPDNAGDTIAVIGGGAVGFETALDFANAGKDVILIEMQEEFLAKMKLQMSCNGGKEILHLLGEKPNFKAEYGCTLSEVKDGAIVCKDAKTGETREIACDTVLLSMGVRERFQLVDELRHCAPESNVAIVGDCRKAATIAEAVNQAFQACVHI
jgi:NADPH-dependent 2,4-dienoyl-CoA reductase/sulfur reductase-like enzyme